MAEIVSWFVRLSPAIILVGWALVLTYHVAFLVLLFVCFACAEAERLTDRIGGRHDPRV